jgi:hypothetical protein
MADHVQSLKEVLRHVLVRAGGPGTLRALKRMRKLPTEHLADIGLEGRFSAIYRERVWSSDGSPSGPGSDPQSTLTIADDLARVLAELGALHVTDIGCGDFGWMKGVTGDFHYCGLDIVSGLIDALNERYGNHSRRIMQCDATRDRLPAGDVAICREVLFHLSFSDARALIANVAHHRYRYLIATSDTAIWFNADIQSGDYRPVNLARLPFRFPTPIELIPDSRLVPHRVLGVWRLADVVRPAD